METLKLALDKQVAASAAKYSEERRQSYHRGIQAVVESDIASNALQVGDTTLDFTLKNAIGNNVTLSKCLSKGPVVLTWYRGGWCPYCNIALRYLQQCLPDLKELNATLIALTPEISDKSLTTTQKNDLEFEVVTDNNNEVAKAYGLVFKLIPEVAEIYQDAFDLAGYNGNGESELPLAATYVIDRNAEIKYAFLDADYRNRAEPSEVLDTLKSL